MQLPTVSAYLNHGRWIADCGKCNGAEIVTPSAPFTCTLCGSEARPVFPEDFDEINRLAALRENPLNRNWTRGESITDLRLENAAHGIENN